MKLHSLPPTAVEAIPSLQPSSLLLGLQWTKRTLILLANRFLLSHSLRRPAASVSEEAESVQVRPPFNESTTWHRQQNKRRFIHSRRRGPWLAQNAERPEGNILEASNRTNLDTTGTCFLVMLWKVGSWLSPAVEEGVAQHLGYELAL